MAVPTVTDVGVEVRHSYTRIAQVALVKGEQVLQGTAPNQVTLPASQGLRCDGITLDDAAIGEPVSICDDGDVYVIDELGTLNKGDNVTNSGTSGKLGQGVVAASGDWVNARVIGKDATDAAQYVIARVEKSNAIPLA